MIDEPELGLHPDAIELVGGMTKSAAQSAQILIATQSALLVDQFEPGDILVLERHGRTSSLTRLEAEPLEAWLEEYSLGELWRKNLYSARSSTNG